MSIDEDFLVFGSV